MPGSRSCVICGASLGALAPPAARTCDRAACAWRFQATPPEQRCGVCERPLTVAERAAGVCAALECRRAWVTERRRDTLQRAAAARAERTRASREAFDAEAGRERTARARAVGLPEAAAAAYPVVPVPSFTGRTGRLPAVRLRRLRAHLEDVIAGAMRLRAGGAGAPPPQSEPPPPALAAVFARACTHCRGFCCRHGGEHAYLREDTMLRYLDAHPDATADDVLAEYLGHLGPRSYRGSCVYHGAHGCTLPRTLRADLCNRYLCDGLKELRDGQRQGAPGAFLAWSRDGHVGGTFVEPVAAAPEADGAVVQFISARELRVRRHHA